MSIELKDLFVAVGLEADTEFETIEDFNKEFNKDFIKRTAVKDDKDLAGAILGKRIGAEEVDLKRAFKSMGVEFEPSELKDEDGDPTPLLEIRKLGFEKLDVIHKAKIKELEDAATGDTDEQITELKGKLEKSKKLVTQLKESNVTLTETVDSQKTDFKKKINSNLVSTELNTIKGGLTFKDGITEIEKSGFQHHLDTNFSFKVETEGEGDEAVQKVVVRDNDGDLIQNEKKAGEFLSPKDVIEQEAVSNKLLKLSSPEDPKKKPFTPKEGEKDKDDIISVKIHPNAAKAAETEA